jgi:meso-butanediol dehydrogenase/(S,S)-butanediol dehydrogenase/diacetyl reductase
MGENVESDESPVVIVTGASSGIGRATAVRLARRGWSVVASARNEGRLAEAVKETPGIETFVADVSSREDNEAMVEFAVSRFGRLDGVVLNAGVSVAAPIEAVTESDLSRHLDVNLKGVVYGVQAALPSLRSASHPAIVVTASMNGLGGDSATSVYSASKFAAVGMVKSLARELGRDGVRVNAVCPGPTHYTGMSTPFEREYPEAFAEISRQMPLARWADPDELAAAVEFLVSPAASFISGVALPVDGGASAGSGLHPPARSGDEVHKFEFSESIRGH